MFTTSYSDHQNLLQDLVAHIDDLEKDNTSLTIQLKSAQAEMGKLEVTILRLQDSQLELVAKMQGSDTELGRIRIPLQEKAEQPLRKRILHPKSAQPPPWLDLAEVAEIELSSEDPGFTIESALGDGKNGWKAGAPGTQTIRICFTTPQHIRRVHLEFQEPERARTQEYSIAWSNDGSHAFREAVRQQWNFNPGNAASEIETHHVDLENVQQLELKINPDIASNNAFATLAKLRIA